MSLLFCVVYTNLSMRVRNTCIYLYLCHSLRLGVAVTSPNTQAGEHRLSAGRYCLFSIFAATFHLRCRSSVCKPEDSPYNGDRDRIFLCKLHIWCVYIYIYIYTHKTVHSDIKHVIYFFKVFLTVHLRIDFFKLPSLCTIPLFFNNMYVTLRSSTCFEQHPAHPQ